MKEKNSLKIHGVVMIIILVIQYLLGMATNLFVKFPEKVSVGQFWEFAWKQVPLALHILIGFALLIGSIVLVVRAFMKKDKRWIVASIIGAIAIFVAGFAGASFIPSQKDWYSYIMAISFIVALLSYFWGII